MSSRLVLESFDAPVQAASAVTGAAPAQVASAAEIEARVSAAYEKGFRAGWDDCLVAGDQDQTRIAEAFGRRLGEVSVSIQDTRATVLSEIEPLFEDILQKILPLTVQKSFLPRLIEEIRQTAEQIGTSELEVVVSAEDATALETLLAKNPDLAPCKVTTDPTLGLSQATLKHGYVERVFDLGGLLDTIEEAFAAFATTRGELTPPDFGEVSNG